MSVEIKISLNQGLYKKDPQDSKLGRKIIYNSIILIDEFGFESFTFKKLVGNYGYPMGNLKDKKAIIFCTYGSPRLAITTFFLNLPIRRLKRGVFHMCGIYNIVYRRYFAVPFVSDNKRKQFLEDVKNTALNI